MGCIFTGLNPKGSADDEHSSSQMAEVKDGKGIEDFDEYDFKNLKNDQAKQILVVDEDTDLQNGRKVQVEDFQFLKVLGKGAFGKVLLVEKKNATGKVYAMKVLRKDTIEKRNQQVHTKSEREILENMSSPFIIQLHFAFQTIDKLYLVMDFMIGGELFFHLRREKRFVESKAKFYAAEIILALEHLHNKGVIYRDLKPENILLDGEGHIKIADFGLSKQGVQSGLKTYTFCGTPEYLAPEILQGLGHDKAVDYWSLGALLYEMLSGAPPHYSRDKNQMFKNILEKPIDLKPHFSAEACSILTALLVIDPKKRLSNATEIKRHEFFKGIAWEKLLKKEIKAPFIPKVTSPTDLRYFDKMFTGESIGETPANPNMLKEGGNTYDKFTYDPQFVQEKDTGSQQ